MALLQNNSKYIKADLQNFRINEGNLYLTFKVYDKTSDREFEKLNTSDIETFKSNIAKYIQKNNLDFSNRLVELGVDLKLDDETKFNRLLIEDSSLKVMVENTRKLKNCLDLALKKMNGEADIDVDVSSLIPFGFNPTWLENPVKIISVTEINVGQYDNQAIDATLIYNKIKERLPQTTDC